MATPELQEFFAALRSGDPDTVEPLLNRLDASLRRIIRSRLRDGRLRSVADTSDIFQSLVKDFLFQNVSERSPSETSGGMSAYFAAAACHKIQGKLRKERRHAGSLADNFEPVSPEPAASKRSEDRDFVETVRDRLGDDRRRLFDLAMQGLSWTQISAIVGGGPDALRMRLRRGIASVLSELGDEGLSHVG